MEITRHPFYKLNYYFEEGRLFKDIDRCDELIEYFKELIKNVENEERFLIHAILCVFATSKDEKVVLEARKQMKNIVYQHLKERLSAASRQIISETIDMLIVCTTNKDNENDDWNYDQWCFKSELIPTQEELF